jgi:hypothetical protein
VISLEKIKKCKHVYEDGSSAIIDTAIPSDFCPCTGTTYSHVRLCDICGERFRHPDSIALSKILDEEDGC